MSAFAAAVDVIFADPNMAADALWLFGGVPPGQPIRVIRKSPDAISDFGAARISQATTVIDVRVSDIPAPQQDDRVMIGDDFFIVQGTPQRDLRRLIWSVNLRPAS